MFLDTDGYSIQLHITKLKKQKVKKRYRYVLYQWDVLLYDYEAWALCESHKKEMQTFSVFWEELKVLCFLLWFSFVFSVLPHE